MHIATLRDAALDLLLPRTCLACDSLLSQSDGGLVCGLCWSRVSTLPDPRCARCGHPMRDPDCSWCPALPAFVRAARSYCWYPSASASRIVTALKYGGWHRVADEMAQRMSRLTFPHDVRAENPLLVPVPLSDARQRERGYNQSLLLANALARRWNLRLVVDCLRRSRSTVSQTRLTPQERARNVAGAFAVGPPAAPSLRGAHVLLVDDIVTTSATMNECATALFQGGARIISYITFGRAHAAGDSI